MASYRLSVSAKSPDDGKGVTLFSINMGTTWQSIPAILENLGTSINTIQEVTSASITGWSVTTNWGTDEITVTTSPGNQITPEVIMTEGFTDTTIVPTFNVYGLNADDVVKQAGSIKFAANPTSISSDDAQDAINAMCGVAGLTGDRVDLTISGKDTVTGGD